MFRELRPVGEAVSLAIQAAGGDQSNQFSQPTQFYHSGTASLAAALLAAKKRAASARPNVLMPAYVCPDLVSAAVYAGVSPKLVDFEPSRPWMNLAALAQQLDHNTVAVVAVNFLGIAERLVEIKALLANKPITLIEDSAQSFRCHVTTPADYTVISFGRGKPVSLLGGGAVIAANQALLDDLPIAEPSSETAEQPQLSYRIKAMLYNVLIEPRIYWLLAYAPFISLGETVYKTLTDLAGLPAWKVSLLAENIARYYQQPRLAQSQLIERLSGMLAAESHNTALVDLPAACGLPTEEIMLRYPLLLPDANSKQQCYTSFSAAGLGASRLYPAVLPDIPGVAKHIENITTYPHAADFCARLLTLPVHSHVSIRDANNMLDLIKQHI